MYISCLQISCVCNITLCIGNNTSGICSSTSCISKVPHECIIASYGYAVAPHVYGILPHVYGTVPHVYGIVPHVYGIVLCGCKMLRMYSAHGRGPINGSCYFSASEYPRFESYLDRSTRMIKLFSLCCEITCLEAWIYSLLGLAFWGGPPPFLKLVTFLTAFVVELSQCSLPSPIFLTVFQVWRQSLFL